MKVIEVVLFWVDIDLIYKSGDFCVMLLVDFIEDIMKGFVSGKDEVYVDVI